MAQGKCVKANIIGRGVEVLLVVKSNKIVTVQSIREQAMPDLSVRTVQRYMASLQEVGLVRRVGNGGNNHYRYFLTPKAEKLFGVANDK